MENGYTEQQLKSLKGIEEYDFETLKNIIKRLEKENEELKKEIKFLKSSTLKLLDQLER